MPVSVAATSTAAAQEQQQQQQMQQQHHSKEQQMYSYDEYEEPVSTVNCSSLRSPRTCSTLINSTLAYSTLESAIPPDQWCLHAVTSSASPIECIPSGSKLSSDLFRGSEVRNQQVIGQSRLRCTMKEAYCIVPVWHLEKVSVKVKLRIRGYLTVMARNKWPQKVASTIQSRPYLVQNSSYLGK